MTTSKLLRITRYTSLLLYAVLAGIAAIVMILELALRQLDGADYIWVRQAKFYWFTWFIVLVFVATLVAVVVLIIQGRKARGPPLRPAIVALALLLLMLAVTAVVNAPINLHQYLDWNPQAPPADWAAVRDRWQIAHALGDSVACWALGFLSSTTQSRA